MLRIIWVSIPIAADPLIMFRDLKRRNIMNPSDRL